MINLFQSVGVVTSMGPYARPKFRASAAGLEELMPRMISQVETLLYAVEETKI